MKLTASQLKKIIAEETRRALREVDLAASREVKVDEDDDDLDKYKISVGKSTIENITFKELKALVDAASGIVSSPGLTGTPAADSDVPDGRLGMYDESSIKNAKGKVRSAASRDAVDAAVLAADDLRMDIYYEALDGDADGDEDEAYEMASAAMAQFWGEMMDEGHVDPNFVVRAKSAFDAKWL